MRTRSVQSEQRGDTIVEVLISIAIISLVLATAYAISNRSTSTNQDTQERGQAQQLVQSQVEGLRALAQTDSLTGFNPDDCITGTATLSLVAPGPSNDNCMFSPSGAICADSDPFCYQITITVSAGIYTVTGEWDNLHGSKSMVELEYGV